MSTAWSTRNARTGAPRSRISALSSAVHQSPPREAPLVTGTASWARFGIAASSGVGSSLPWTCRTPESRSSPDRDLVPPRMVRLALYGAKSRFATVIRGCPGNVRFPAGAACASLSVRRAAMINEIESLFEAARQAVGLIIDRAVSVNLWWVAAGVVVYELSQVGARAAGSTSFVPPTRMRTGCGRATWRAPTWRALA